jgi:hypothetical protein
MIAIADFDGKDVTELFTFGCGGDTKDLLMQI